MSCGSQTETVMPPYSGYSNAVIEIRPTSAAILLRVNLQVLIPYRHIYTYAPSKMAQAVTFILFVGRVVSFSA
jgi:hypothetical protein